MSSANRRDQRIAKLYERIPSPNCKGLCHDQCTVIAMSGAEMESFAEKGIRIEHDRTTFVCNKLCAATKRCTVYEQRPMICRIYGASQDLPCEHGCTPTITGQQAHALLDAVDRIETTNKGFWDTKLGIPWKDEARD